MKKLRELERAITGCRLCPRLVLHREDVAATKRRAYRDETYWGRPIPGFGDPTARLVILGLAPGAHGANRTGRVFTGDSSGDWLYRALWKAGFASQPTSTSKDDGLVLTDAWITLAARCVPPDNKPSRDELAACAPFLERELALFPRARVILALGRVAFDAWLGLRPEPLRPRPTFAHGAEHAIGDVTLLASYHPSRQNTQTGRLTEPMLDSVFARARALVTRR
jgi:uracil-DNA glycosylase family 4